MKKISMIMSSLLAVLFFIAMFFSMGNDNYRDAVDTNAYFKTSVSDKKEGISLILDNQIVEDEYYQNQIYDIFKKYNVIATGLTQYKGIDLQKDIFYVYAETDIYDGQIATVDDIRIDFANEQEDRYYALHKKEKKAIKIDLLNPMFYDYVTPYEVHPFHQIKGNRMPTLLNVSGISVAEFEKEIKECGLKPYVESVQPLDMLNNFSLRQEEGIQFDPNNILLICIVLAFVTLILLIIVNTVKHKKMIAVCRLNGISKIRIIKKQFVGFLLNLFISYSLTQLLLLYIFAGPYRETTSSFYHFICLSILGFLVLIIALLLFVYLYLYLNRNFHDLKQNKINAFSIRMNIITKIIMSTVLITPFVSIVPDFFSQIHQTMALHNMKLESENRYGINIYADKYTNLIGGDKAEEVTSQVLTILAEQYDGKLYDIWEWYVRYKGSKEENNFEEISTSIYDVPFIYVNRNYLKDYSIQSYQSDKELDINTLRGGVILVPKEHEDSESLLYYKNQLNYSQEIIIENNTNDYKVLKFNDAELNDKYIKNPIIYVCDEEVPKTISTMQSSFYINTDDLPMVYKSLSEAGFKDNITFNSLLPVMQQAYNKQLVTFSSMAFLLIGYLTVYLVFVYQSIYVYLDVYKRKIAVQYLHGFSYIKRYHEIYIINACAYLIAAIAAYLIYRISLLDVLLYVTFFGGIEIIFEIYQIYRFEKREGIQSLK